MARYLALNQGIGFESIGQRFLVDFGLENAVALARDHWREEPWISGAPPLTSRSVTPAAHVKA